MKKIIACVLLLCAWPVLGADYLQLSQNEIALGDGVELSFVSDNPIQTPPDLSPLFTYNFKIAGNKTKPILSVSGTQVLRKYAYTVIVYPQRVGQFVLSGLKLNNNSLQPVKLNVKNSRYELNDKTYPLQNAVTKGPYYEGAAFVFMTEFPNARRYRHIDIKAPQLDQSSIRKLDYVPSQYADWFNVAYMIVPHKTGNQTISPLSFVGNRVIENATSALLQTEVAQQIFQGVPMTIEVKPKPGWWKGWWLPASAISLTEEYHMPDEIRVGVPIERIITLRADNVDESSLKLPHIKTDDRLRIYDSGEDRQRIVTDSGIQSILVSRLSVVPLKTGMIEIPELKLAWFDVKTEQRSYAILPSKKIRVLESLVPFELADDAPEVEPQHSSWWNSFSQVSLLPTSQYFSEKEMRIVVGLCIWMTLVLTMMIVLIIRRVTRQKKQKVLPDLYRF